jgi:hypothetical protein
MAPRSTIIAIVAVALAASATTLAGCGPNVSDGEGDGEGVPMIPPSETGPSANLAPGSTANVTADFLNLRDKAGTDGNILVAMPCGSLLNVQAGPTTAPVAGWWQVLYSAANGTPYSGWCSGKYLIASGMFDPNSCGASAPDGGGTAPPTQVPEIFDRAKSAVGYSYWWGHGAWRTDGSNQGSCSGTCPSCDHSGSYGADCSGFVAKVWQVPSASALGVDEHPFSTYNFYNEQTYWAQIDRATLAPADALVRRDATSGHIALVDSASDPYGSIWLYEARGCATGVVHNLRSVDSSYRAIRRDGL